MSQGSPWTRFRPTISRVVARATPPMFIAGMCGAIWMENQLRLPIIYRDVIYAIGFGVFTLVGSVLVAQRPENLVSWIVLAIGLMAGVFPAAETYAAYVMTTRGTPNTLAVLGAWFNDIYWYPLAALAFIYLPLLFPNGRLPTRRWLPVALIPGVATLGLVVLAAFRETLIGQNVGYRIANPIGIKGLIADESQPLFILFLVMTGIGVLGAVTSVFVRFRRSTGAERQQLKIFLYASAFLPILAFPSPPPPVGDILFALILIALPTAIGVAVSRYRLYDIDIIIRRTLVYSALTATLALVFFGSVLMMQEIFQAMTGQGESPIATVISTLGIAGLFTPLRRRIQRDIDRRFYRRSYDAERTLEAFAARARNEVELEQLTAYLLSVVRETMQPEHVSLWLKPIKQ